jgi:hypothetical protein
MRSVHKFSEGIRVDKFRRDSSFVILWRRIQEKVRARKSVRLGEILEEEESMTRFRRGASQNPVDHQISRRCTQIKIKRREEEPKSHRDSTHHGLRRQVVVAC